MAFDDPDETIMMLCQKMNTPDWFMQQVRARLIGRSLRTKRKYIKKLCKYMKNSGVEWK